MGTNVTEITGILTYDYGFYRLLPLTAPTVIAHNETLQEPTTLTTPVTDANCILTFGDYNVNNMYWGSDRLPLAASQIGDYLMSPDLVFLQEIQDDSGPSRDGVVTSNRTLQTFVDAIASHSGVRYNYTYIAPQDGQDGGQEGGNIRTAFLYRPERLRLVNPKYGGPTDKTEVVNNNGTPGLTYVRFSSRYSIPDDTFRFNPGRIDPTNTFWRATRKPLVALFESIGSGEQIFAINVHMTSKGGSSSLHGDLRPPVNAGVTKRAGQVQVVAVSASSFIEGRA
jgi:predicted extracellular nuclease